MRRKVRLTAKFFVKVEISYDTGFPESGNFLVTTFKIIKSKNSPVELKHFSRQRKTKQKRL